MSWVNETELDKYLEILSSPPIQDIQDLYTDTVTVEFDGVKLPTTIVSSDAWMEFDTRPTIKVNEADARKEINKQALHSIATLNAFKQQGLREISKAEIGNYMWNGDTYIINKPLSLDTTPETIEVAPSDFYSVISHTSQLLGEIVTGSHELVRSNRLGLFDTTGSLTRNISSYYRPLGGTYLTVVLDDDGTYYLLLGKRGSKVVLWPELVTAFPSGYFKPNDVTHGDLIEQQLLSEYAREAMDTEVKEKSDDMSKGVNAVSQLLRAGEASFDITGFGIEAATVSAELTGVLQIDYPEYTEYLFKNLEQSYDVSHITAIPLDESMSEKLQSIFANGDITPQTVFALGMGLQHLDNNTSVDVPFDVEVLLE